MSANASIPYQWQRGRDWQRQVAGQVNQLLQKTDTSLLDLDGGTSTVATIDQVIDVDGGGA